MKTMKKLMAFVAMFFVICAHAQAELPSHISALKKALDEDLGYILNVYVLAGDDYEQVARVQPHTERVNVAFLAQIDTPEYALKEQLQEFINEWRAIVTQNNAQGSVLLEELHTSLTQGLDKAYDRFLEHQNALEECVVCMRSAQEVDGGLVSMRCSDAGAPYKVHASEKICQGCVRDLAQQAGGYQCPLCRSHDAQTFRKKADGTEEIIQTFGVTRQTEADIQRQQVAEQERHAQELARAQQQPTVQEQDAMRRRRLEEARERQRALAQEQRAPMPSVSPRTASVQSDGDYSTDSSGEDSDDAWRAIERELDKHLGSF